MLLKQGREVGDHYVFSVDRPLKAKGARALDGKWHPSISQHRPAFFIALLLSLKVGSKVVPE